MNSSPRESYSVPSRRCNGDRPPSILKVKDDCYSTHTGDVKTFSAQCTNRNSNSECSVRNPYRRLRDRSELNAVINAKTDPKPGVKFNTNTLDGSPDINRARSAAHGSSDKCSSAVELRGVSLEESSRLRRLSSAPSSQYKSSGITQQRQSHLQSITMYVDDFQNPGQKNKLTIAFSASTLKNQRLLTEDILRFAKHKKNYFKTATKEAESKLHAHHQKRQERIRQKEEIEKKLKESEEEHTNRNKPVSKTLNKDKTSKLSVRTMLTSNEMKEFRKQSIAKRTSMMPGYLAEREREKSRL